MLHIQKSYAISFFICLGSSSNNLFVPFSYIQSDLTKTLKVCALYCSLIILFYSYIDSKDYPTKHNSDCSLKGLFHTTHLKIKKNIYKKHINIKVLVKSYIDNITFKFINGPLSVLLRHLPPLEACGCDRGPRVAGSARGLRWSGGCWGRSCVGTGHAG